MKREDSGAATLLIMIFYVFIVLILGYLTKAPFEKIVLGTFPLLLYIAAFLLLGLYRNMRSFAIWIAPLILPMIFFALWYSESVAVLQTLDGFQLTLFNIVLSYIVNILFLLSHPGSSHHHPQHRRQIHHQMHPKPVQHHRAAHHHQQRQQHAQRTQQQQNPHHYASQLHHYHRQNQQYVQQINQLRQQVHHLQKQNQITPQTFQVNLKSIEDKCKAINFVIGRVYSDKKGGSPETREKINIPREMYNSFSELATNLKQEDLGKLMHVLSEINNKLVQMELPENQLLTISKNPHITINRNPNGTDRIIEVLANNDQDPIVEYHNEAKEICKRLTDYVRQHYR